MGTKRRWVIVGLIVFLGFTGLISAGYWFNWDWTGLNQHIGPKVPQYQPTKTLWDWLQLLIIPVVLAVAALLFNLAATRTEQKIAATRYEQDKEIALDKQREDLFQIYLDRISDLLLKEKLRSSAVDTEVRNVARVRTITILSQLDAKRIGYVFSFLREAGLMSKKPNSSIISLHQANLEEIDLSQTDLPDAVLSGANLRKADLSQSNLSRANLSRADLNGADLTRAVITEEQLKKARSLMGAILPDGSKHP